VAFCELKYFSKALCKQTAANLILPQNDAPPPYAVLYLLHGLSDDHTIWHRRTSIERYVSDYPLIVVMPDSGRGFYTDAKEGDAWETAIVRDLVGYVDQMLPTRPTREGRCLGGLSMGGFGAIKLALKYPDLFGSAVSHSGALGRAHRSVPRASDNPFDTEMRRIFGEHPEGGPDDPFALAERLEPAKRPALRIDCGTEDFLIEDNRAFHAHLTEIGYPHEYEEFPGEHEWGYWDRHVQEAIRFHARNMGIRRVTAPRRDVTRRE
jgi:S-formylglutathione hydrolase FrmB